MTWEGRRYEVTGKTEAEAMEKLGALKETLRRGEGTIGPDVTVDRWFREWLDLYKVPAGLTEKSLGMYGEKYRNYIGPAIGRMRMREVREAHLQRILNTQAGRSFSHVSKLRLVMKEMFSRAASTRIIPFDPFCTDLQRSETPINVAKELMGHQDVSTTANIYTHKDQDVLRKFIDKTENYNITETKSVCYADALALAIGQGVADFGLPKPKITAHTTSYTTPAEPVPVENPVEKVFG